jgi:hypothetical protein
MPMKPKPKHVPSMQMAPPPPPGMSMQK